MDLLRHAVKDLIKSEKKVKLVFPTPDDDLKLALQEFSKADSPEEKAEAFKAAMEIYKLQTSDKE